MTNFSDLGLMEPLLRAIDAEGYTTPTPIQAGSIPHLIDGRDLLGIAQTGTGKTAAFALPILHRLADNPRRAKPRSARVLVLSPTRELAVQISQSFQTYGRHLHMKRTQIYGGVGQRPQVQSIARGTDILIATPGRLLDLMNQGHVHLGDVEVFVLDEADRMLDMGFVNDVKKIAAKLPAKRQTLLFSATMPKAIAALAASLLDNPERIEVTPEATTVERIDQKVMFVERADKRHLLAKMIKEQPVGRAIVFTRTKHGANRLAMQLQKGGLTAEAIHGDKSQNARQRALDAFKRGRVQMLVATDIAARGIDVDGVTHVFNFELPMEPESYVHRIGRTARAGTEGIAVSFCDGEEVPRLRAIERTIRQPVPIDDDHPFHAEGVAKIALDPRGGRPARKGAPGKRGGQRPGQRPGQGPGKRPGQKRAQGGPRAHNNGGEANGGSGKAKRHGGDRPARQGGMAPLRRQNGQSRPEGRTSL